MNDTASGDQAKLAQLDQQLKEISSQGSQPQGTTPAPPTQPSQMAAQPNPAPPSTSNPVIAKSEVVISQQGGEGVATDMASPPPPDTANIPVAPTPQTQTPAEVTPEVTPVVGTPKTTVSSRLSSKMLWVLAGLLFIVVAGLAAYLGVTTAPKLTPSPTPEPLTDQTPLPLVSKDLYLDGDLYVSDTHGFSFKHFGLNSGCCTLSGPAEINPVVGITLAKVTDDGTGTDEAFDGFAVYVVANTSDQTLTVFVSSQMTALTNALETTGAGAGSVAKTQTETTVAGRQAVMLTGYSTSGALYFVQLSTGDFLVISKSDATPGSFDDQFEEILNSFVFVDVLVKGQSVDCSQPRPEFCTEECIANPPYICGDNGKSYCSVCSACSDTKVASYTYQDTQCTTSAGQICGGIAGIECPTGYTCDLGGSETPDASGVCVAN